MIKWVVVEPDSDQTDYFALESNGASSLTLQYLAPNFKLVDTEVQIFDALLTIDHKNVYNGSFEWRAGTLSHKIAETIQDQQIK